MEDPTEHLKNESGVYYGYQMFRFIKAFFREILGEWGRFIDDSLRFRDPKTELENQLRIMYGRGEISKEVYRQLHLRLTWNQIGKGDLTLLHQGYLRKLAAQGRILEVESPETRRLLDRLYLDRVLMEEAVENISARNQSLNTEIRWLNEQAEAARANAKQALPDESLARTYLEVWQDLRTLAKELIERQLALEGQRRQMEAQAAQLKAAMTRLKLLQSQERLLELNLRVRQDLLPHAKEELRKGD